MNKFLMLGRSNLGTQRVDVHAVTQLRCDLSRAWKWMMRSARS